MPRFSGLGEDLEPELGALAAGAGPQPQDLPPTVNGDPDGGVDGPVGDLTVADLHEQGVDEHHRVDPLEWAGRPLGHLLQDPVGDLRHRLPGHLGAVHLGQVRLHLPGGEPLGGERDDHLVHAPQAPLALGHQLGFETAVAVTGHRKLHWPHVGDHGLGPGAVAGVPAVAPGGVMALIAHVVGHLGFQAGLEHPLGEITQQAARADQVHALGAGLLHELLC